MSTPNGTTSQALVAADLAHIVWAVNLGCLGFHVWPNLAADDDARRRAAHRPRSATRRRLRRGPRRGARAEDAARRARHRRAARRRPATAASTCTCGSRPRWIPIEVRRGRGRRGARARAPPSRRDHRRVVEGGARRADLRRLQPERAAQDGVRRVVGAGPARRAGVDAVRLGRARRRSTPTRCTIATVPARVADARRPVGRHRRRPAVARAAARDVRRATSPSGLQDAPWPPVYPKMPGEPPRVAPSRAKKPAAEKKPAPTKKKAPAKKRAGS